MKLRTKVSPFEDTSKPYFVPLRVNNLADVRTCDVVATPLPHILGCWIDIW